jgi:hypothetical protein
MRLAGRVVAITGGRSGLGRRRLSSRQKRGARAIAVIDRDSAAGERLAAEVGESPSPRMSRASSGCGPRSPLWRRNSARWKSGCTTLASARRRRRSPRRDLAADVAGPRHGDRVASRSLLPRWIERADGLRAQRGANCGHARGSRTHAPRPDRERQFLATTYPPALEEYRLRSQDPDAYLAMMRGVHDELVSGVGAVP